MVASVIKTVLKTSGRDILVLGVPEEDYGDLIIQRRTPLIRAEALGLPPGAPDIVLMFGPREEIVRELQGRMELDVINGGC